RSPDPTREPDAGPAVERGRVERPHHPHVLRGPGPPPPLRLRPVEGDDGDAPDPSRGQGRRRHAAPRAGRDLGPAAPLVRAAGHPGSVLAAGWPRSGGGSIASRSPSTGTSARSCCTSSTTSPTNSAP